jgi:hypothetical protein
MVLLGKISGLEDYAKKCQSDASACTSTQRSGSGMKSTMPFSLCGELFQQVIYTLWELRNAT